MTHMERKIAMISTYITISKNSSVFCLTSGDIIFTKGAKTRQMNSQLYCDNENIQYHSCLFIPHVLKSCLEGKALKEDISFLYLETLTCFLPVQLWSSATECESHGSQRRMDVWLMKPSCKPWNHGNEHLQFDLSNLRPPSSQWNRKYTMRCSCSRPLSSRPVGGKILSGFNTQTNSSLSKSSLSKRSFFAFL